MPTLGPDQIRKALEKKGQKDPTTLKKVYTAVERFFAVLTVVSVAVVIVLIAMNLYGCKDGRTPVEIETSRQLNAVNLDYPAVQPTKKDEVLGQVFAQQASQRCGVARELFILSQELRSEGNDHYALLIEQAIARGGSCATTSE